MPTPENQAKIAWLNRYHELDTEINRKCEELSRWRSRAEKITPTLSQAPGGGGNGDRVADAVEKIMGIEEEINADIDRLISIRGEVEKAIKSVPNETLRTLLELRYIDGKSWSGVCTSMFGKRDNFAESYDSCLRNIYRWHGRALAEMSLNVTMPK